MENNKTKRLITISRKVENRDGRFAVTPFLRITGKWFEKAGFCIGDIVEIDVENGRLVVKKTKNSWRVEKRAVVEKYMVDEVGERIA